MMNGKLDVHDTMLLVIVAGFRHPARALYSGRLTIGSGPVSHTNLWTRSRSLASC